MSYLKSAHVKFVLESHNSCFVFVSLFCSASWLFLARTSYTAYRPEHIYSTRRNCVGVSRFLYTIHYMLSVPQDLFHFANIERWMVSVSESKAFRSLISYPLGALETPLSVACCCHVALCLPARNPPFCHHWFIITLEVIEKVK